MGRDIFLCALCALFLLAGYAVGFATGSQAVIDQAVEHGFMKQTSSHEYSWISRPTLTDGEGE